MKCSQINRYNEIQIIQEMRSPWQLIMWKRKQFNKGQTHFENRLGKGKAGGRGSKGGRGLGGGGRGQREEVVVGSRSRLPLRLVSGAIVKDHCPSQGRLP